MNQPKESRRVFLKKLGFWRRSEVDQPPTETQENEEVHSTKTEAELDLESQASQAYYILKQKLMDIKLTRRLFMGVGGLLVGGVTIDQLILGGKFTQFSIQFVNDPIFRQKVVDVISSGEILEKISNVIHDVEQEGQTAPTYELGEIVDLREAWLDQIFDRYQVRKLERGREETDLLMLVADVDRVLTIESHVYWLPRMTNTGLTNFTETQRIHGPFASLPSNQVEMVDNFKIPRMYSAYQLENGSVVEYFEEEGQPRKNRGGGLVLLFDQSLIAIPNEQIEVYRVGDNCLAIETAAFSVSSTRIEADLAAIDQTPVFSGVRLSRSPRYDSVIVTFHKENGEQKTQLISTYQHLDVTQRRASGGAWASGQRMTIRQAAQVCEDLKVEGGWQDFVMMVPDPEEESQVNGPNAFDALATQEMAQWTSVDGITELRQSEPGVSSLRHRGLGGSNVHEVKPKQYFLAVKR